MRFSRLFFLCAIFGYLHFGFASEWDIVYLASFPRSGNHWVRFLIEEATHIATSSLYIDREYPRPPVLLPCDGYALDRGYGGACRYPRKSEPVVVKTHYPCFFKSFRPIQRIAICLVRHPIDAIYSFHVYRQKKDEQQKIPEEILQELIAMWRTFYEFWDQQPNVVLIRYEDLCRDPAFYLTKILQAIGYESSPEDIQRAVNAYPSSGDFLKYIRYYDEEELELVKDRLGDFLLKYGYGYLSCGRKKTQSFRTGMNCALLLQWSHC